MNNSEERLKEIKQIKEDKQIRKNVLNEFSTKLDKFNRDLHIVGLIVGGSLFVFLIFLSVFENLL